MEDNISVGAFDIGTAKVTDSTFVETDEGRLLLVALIDGNGVKHHKLYEPVEKNKALSFDLGME